MWWLCFIWAPPHQNNSETGNPSSCYNCCIQLLLVNSFHFPCLVLYFDFQYVWHLPLPQHCVLHHLIKNIIYQLYFKLEEHLHTYIHAIWQRNIAHLATQSQTLSQYKGVEVQIHNPERNAVSQTYHRITLPLTQPQYQKKNQLISSHSADQNQAMLCNINFLPKCIS